MSEYRRRRDRDTWHWCKNCSNWPTQKEKPEVCHSKPSTGELCNQCRSKAKHGECRT